MRCLPWFKGIFVTSGLMYGHIIGSVHLLSAGKHWTKPIATQDTTSFPGCATTVIQHGSMPI
jgi:hypothetical protein